MTLLVAGGALSQTVEVRRVQTTGPVVLAKRHTLAIKYKDNDDTSVNIIGTALNPHVIGKADIKRKEGRTRVKLKIQDLGHPQYERHAEPDDAVEGTDHQPGKDHRDIEIHG